MIELIDPMKKGKEDDEAMCGLVMMPIDLLNNIVGLNHGDFAKKIISFQKTNLGSTCEIWMLLVLVFQSCFYSSALPFYFYHHFILKLEDEFF